MIKTKLLSLLGCMITASMWVGVASALGVNLCYIDGTDGYNNNVTASTGPLGVYKASNGETYADQLWVCNYPFVKNNADEAIAKFSCTMGDSQGAQRYRPYEYQFAGDSVQFTGNYLLWSNVPISDPVLTISVENDGKMFLDGVAVGLVSAAVNTALFVSTPAGPISTIAGIAGAATGTKTTPGEEVASQIPISTNHTVNLAITCRVQQQLTNVETNPQPLSNPPPSN